MAGLSEGGKAVIIGDAKIKSEELFRAYGRFIESLSGRYITAEDVNIRTEDIDIVAKETSHVAIADKAGESSPHTALGTYQALAAAKHRLGSEDLKGVKLQQL